MGAALRDADIRVRVNSAASDFGSPGQPFRRGCDGWPKRDCPESSNAGYELFDKVGSLGLTSFMQEVTRRAPSRASLARTIQVMKGVKAARVHVVLGERGSFRRERQRRRRPSWCAVTSVPRAARRRPIRYLVAAAVSRHGCRIASPS